ncbi:acetyltransferase [Polynucleobacter paneuropaeus]|nr:acetyltransferase [Polynucleobacter paneuropaeus]
MYILGSGALGEIALETAIRAGLKINGFYDDFTKESERDGVKIIGTFSEFFKNEAAIAEGVFVAIGDNLKRQVCVQSLRELGACFPNIVDPNATLSPSASLGEGNLILPGAYIGTKCSIGSFNIIFPGTSVTHHNYVGDFCFFSPNSSVGGFTKIGNCCKVGMNCVILPYQEIPEHSEYPPSTVSR